VPFVGSTRVSMRRGSVAKPDLDRHPCGVCSWRIFCLIVPRKYTGRAQLRITQHGIRPPPTADAHEKRKKNKKGCARSSGLQALIVVPDFLCVLVFFVASLPWYRRQVSINLRYHGVEIVAARQNTVVSRMVNLDEMKSPGNLASSNKGRTRRADALPLAGQEDGHYFSARNLSAPNVPGSISLV
jgi:hypothetical protein